MLVFAAAIVFQVACVQVSAQAQDPFFMGYMHPNQTSDEDGFISTQFIDHNQIGFNSSSSSNFTRFRINDQGIYWISLRPMNPFARYQIRINWHVIVTTAYETRFTGVGFARYLQRGDQIDVIKLLMVQRSRATWNGDFGMFSIALLRRADNEGEAAAAFWTASYYRDRIDPSITSAISTAIFQHAGGLSSRDRQTTWNYKAPWTGWYWAGIRAVPDGYCSTSTAEFCLKVNQNRLFCTWSSNNPLRASYASRAIYMNANDVVTVVAPWVNSFGHRMCFSADTIVSVVALTLGSSMLVVSKQVRPPPPPPPPPPQEQALPPWYAWMPFLRFGRDASTAAGVSCANAVNFTFVHYDTSDLMEGPVHRTVTIKVPGHYLISLRNAPQLSGQEVKSSMVLYAKSYDRETTGYLMVVEAYSPQDVSNPRGADGVFFLLQGDRLWVEQHYSILTSPNTFWSIALLQIYTEDRAG